LASIDQAKAFDSVSHSYMLKVYDFFGFGCRIKRWLSAIGTGRNACIRICNDSLSASFQLGKGHAQGDSPSPLLYNLAAQIVIFKLEFNKDICRIQTPTVHEEVAVPVPPFYKGEGLGQTDINESFADDSSNLFVFELKSLGVLKEVLVKFRRLSGLSSNLEKSFIMRIGNLEGEIPNDILDLGFTFVDKIKLLGFTLQNYGDTTATNFEAVGIKIDNLIRFWERFFLSLPGRIAIYKTLLLPQINYIATILTPDALKTKDLQSKMEKFVLGSLNIAKDRIYRETSMGGLGLFDLVNFIAALQCTWIKRCAQSINDNWRYRVALLGNGDPLLIANDSKSKNLCGRVLNNILNCYELFKCKYAQVDNNYMVVPIYNNTAFGYGRGLTQQLDDEFFECIGNTALRNTVLGITWNDITTNEQLFTREQLSVLRSINLSAHKYNLLKNAYQIATRRYRKIDAPCTTISDFLKSFKKGSKKFRLVLTGKTPENLFSKSSQVRTFLRSIDLECPAFSRIKSMYCVWNLNYINSRVREFSFKYYNNLLGTNSRVSHFNPEVEAGCTFCTLTNTRPVPKETIQHLFYFCPTTTTFITSFYDKYLCNFLLSPATFFLANISGNEKENRAINLTFDVFRYVLWQFKLEKKIPKFTTLNTEMNYQMGIIIATSVGFKDLLIDCKFFQKEELHGRLPGVVDRP
jgi:hypothetical protein